MYYMLLTLKTCQLIKLLSNQKVIESLKLMDSTNSKEIINKVLNRKSLEINKLLHSIFDYTKIYPIEKKVELNSNKNIVLKVKKIK